MLIYMYGEVGGQYKVRNHTFKKCSIDFSINYKCLTQFFRKYERLQGEWPWEKRKTGPMLKLECIKDYLLNFSTLRAWKGLSLRNRVVKIAHHTQGNIVVTGPTLGNFYRRYRVRNLKVQYTILNQYTDPEMIQQQQYWIKSLCTELAMGKEALYMDEVTINLWQNGNLHTWMPKDRSIKLRLAEQRESGVTVFGCCITNSERFLHRIYQNGTTKENTLDFLTHVKTTLGDESFANMVVVLDRHPSHKSNMVKEFLQESGATMLMLPAASSPLNNVEISWSILKRHYEQELFKNNGMMKRNQLESTITAIIEQHLDGSSMNVANGQKSKWVQSLNGRKL